MAREGKQERMGWGSIGSFKDTPSTTLTPNSTKMGTKPLAQGLSGESPDPNHNKNEEQLNKIWVDLE